MKTCSFSDLHVATTRSGTWEGGTGGRSTGRSLADCGADDRQAGEERGVGEGLGCEVNTDWI